ncbi:isochorismatase domain-containing protein 2 isoform X1 [Hemicordylus capensis]|uniref:isochorismatase domain-containing protein 2 isoform X1 n=1 Tax=Hemicordylus capensis TaxID=884348 RepID=UPI002303D1DD|nr:isochorismatase domain-containing protein 2 isoform X1 [Hemicordylus capensis]XP_053118022.1 isochorismatase domain-containing protein 2 isoform X1 [Hemicordylus capensis]XP_053118023.1 isochorismatase domain-containing protein 2 isoform X1 [Hemicordylus capensis]
MSVTRLGKVVPQTSILFLCDMQEKFRPNISYFPQIVSVAARMLKVAKALEIPIVVTEQYPKGLGLTVQELGAEGLPKYSKTCFSMLIPEVEKEMAAVPNLKSVLLCGIETQACIMSTALDILERGLDVHVVADACSSRSQVDRIVALSRLRQSGAFLTTSEGLILQLVRDAAHPCFREIQKLIKDPAPDSGLLPLLQGPSSLLS